MKRLAEEDLRTWFYKKDRRPLIIRGARQVGKSTLVELFCKSENLQLIVINLELMKLNSVVDGDFDLNKLLDEIQLKSKKTIYNKTIVFFDEIQEAPLLIKYLRYFYEERPEIAVVSAGSLLEIQLKKDPISFPVGRIEFYHLGPMTFKEFLWASGNNFLAEKIEQLDFSVTVAEEAKKALRNYYYVGGMPKAVKTFAEEKSLVSVRSVQEQILQTYVADFPKYNKRIQVDRIDRVFSSIVINLGKKIIYSKIDPGSHSKDTRRIIDLLIDARVVNLCSHSESNSVPLKGELDPTIFKLYFLDVGLVNAMMKLDIDVIDTEMKNNFNSKGIVAEQFVAQHLAYLNKKSTGPELYYWLRDKGSQKGEIDFIWEQKNKIIPIKVKAAESGHLKSLFYFAKEKRRDVAIKCSLDNFDRKETSHRIDGNEQKIKLINIPHFAIEELSRILDRS